MTKQNYINHIALVLDASRSMASMASQVIGVADQQVAYLAQRSKELDQETRVTVYTFSNRVIDCLFYDKDVLRLPSLKGLYRPDGQTALIDATIKALEDLEKTPELYGDHAFLAYVLTDGAENYSRHRPIDLSGRLERLRDNWTVAAFVPNATGVHEAKKFGFAPNNIAVWNADAKGVTEVGSVIRQTTDHYMQARSVGVRGTRSLFTPDTSLLSKRAVSNLDKLGPGQFRSFHVERDERIDEFVGRQMKRPYALGEAYYQLTKSVIVQAQKTIALYAKREHAVYVGKQARVLLGLPDYEVTVRPTNHPEYDIFVQSTSMNRKLLAGTSVLIIPPH